jgi:two-component system response regulator YesN
MQREVDSVYKVLLVDDEPMALEVLKYVGDWGKLGFYVCGTCGNGKEAADAIEKYNPDVIITDIKMPVMDGLDLIRYTRELGKENIKFIVVSGYGDFEYAKRAIQYDVRHYLLKPILEEELYEIIIEIKEQLDMMCRNKQCAEMDKGALLNCVLGHLIRGNNTQKVIQYLKSILEVDTLMMDWNCVVIEFETFDQPDIEEEFKKTRIKVKNAIDEALKNNSGYFVLEQCSNIFIILSSLRNDKPLNGKIDYLAGKIYDTLFSTISSGFTIGVGENAVGIYAVKHSYTTALAALRQKFYRGLNCLIFYDEIKKITFNYKFNDLIMSNKVLEAVEELDANKIRNIIDMTFKYFENNRIDPEIVIMFTSNMICKINHLTYQSDDKAKDLMDNYTIRELKEHERTMQELKEFFMGFCLGYCEYFENARSRDAVSNIATIEVFIKENYKRNITIRELAENVYMHPAYLGQLFTQKFGISFNEYIHKLRIEEAKRLMNETNLKNNEIGEGLGYCNYNSFLQQFHKYTGMKPTEFRNSVH